MENNNNNNFEPQLPFTDKAVNNEPNFQKNEENVTNNFQQQQNSSQGFTTQNNQQVHQPTDYSQSSYFNSAQGYQQNMTPPPYGQPPYQQPPYGQQQPQQFYGVPPYQPYYNQAPQNRGIPYAPYEPFAPQPPKSKMNGGLIAVIVVLSVLLVSSLLGIFIYAATQEKDKEPSYKPSYDFTLPSFTLPNEDDDDDDNDHEKHEESDYSDKIIKDYKGLEFKSKPKDYNDSSKYTSQYSYAQASESVVGILCYSGEIKSTDECDSQGSGIIISADGYVITNSHVIANSRTDYLIQVVTADGTSYKAGVVGYDSRTDLAVLKMDKAKNLKPAVFGNSKQVVVGDDIIVIGNPGGLTYNNSLTKGIVSAVDRNLSSSSLVEYIQIDAAINPGNSGGPVVNMYGQVVGIATSKIVNEKYEGMGFAIPTSTVKEITDELIKNGYVSNRVKIGISGFAISSSASQLYDIPTGIYIESIIEDGPCDNTDIKKGDIITSMDGKTVETFADVYKILEKHKAGDKIELEYYRRSSGKEGTVKIVLQEDKSE